MPRKTIAERFWSKVDKNGPIPSHRPELGPCWIWIGSTTSDGYGRFWDGERLVLPHRYAWEQVNGEMPPEIKALHHCDTPSCIRDSHIFTGTQRDNTLDSIRKGRYRGGWPKTNLSKEAIEDIRASGLPQKKLATKYGVSQAHVSRIIRRQVAF